jgi:hypothetical protein
MIEDFETIDEAIMSIPGENGFWKSANHKNFRDAFDTLVAKGFTENEAFSFLDSVYWNVAAEFGS